MDAPRSSERPVARLVLEDGTIFTGRGFGACDEPRSSTGEVVFNTAMTGYQEAFTDPSYAGQILTMTAPHIGNYGVCDEDLESSRPQVAGLVVRELSRHVTGCRAEGDLSGWLASAGVLGLDGVDTRALVRRIRQSGAMRGVISCDVGSSDGALLRMVEASPRMAGRNLAAGVSTTEPTTWEADLGRWAGASLPEGGGGSGRRRLRVAALDCGAKHSILRHLVARGCDVRVLPVGSSADEVRAVEPDGLFVSNGPGDPEAIEATIATLAALLDDDLPTFGICLGQQLLALALGASTFKLKFGHRGCNQPVRNTLTGAVEITSQNHGFCVQPEELESIDCEITHRHLNDGTVAGFRHRTRPIFAVQFHPEASPGPHDSGYLFDCFLDLMRTRRPVSEAVMARWATAGRGE